MDALKRSIKQHLDYCKLNGLMTRTYRFGDYCGNHTTPHDGEISFFGDVLGLRKMGYSDEITSLRHSGWYVDEYGDQGTIRGVVYRLPARKGKNLFIVGRYWSDNDSTTIDASRVYSDEHDAAHAADKTAEKYAEVCREDNEKFEAEQLMESLREELRTTRENVIDIRNGAKTAKKYLCEQREYFKDRIRGIIELKEKPWMVREWR